MQNTRLLNVAGLIGFGVLLLLPLAALVAGMAIPVWALPYFSILAGGLIALIAFTFIQAPATQVPALAPPGPDRSAAPSVQEFGDEVFAIAPGTLNVAYMNSAGARRLPGTVGEVATLCDVLGSRDVGEIRALVTPLMTGEAERLAFRAIIGGSETYDVRAHLSPGIDPRIVLVLRNVSDQVEREGAQGEVLATISHELRTPMTSIKGAIGLLLSNAAGDLPDRARDMLSIAYRNADRMVMIINDILDIEKIAAGEMVFDMRWAPLSRVIEEAVAANEQFADRFDVRVVCNDIDAHCHASHDFARTLQVLTNLLSNAAKFSPPGGQVNVIMARVGDRVRISVQDFGDGIEESAQARIFERFAQVESGGQRGVAGSGLGLSIARAIMEQQGGSIGVHSQPGQGSTFFVEFPAGNPDLAGQTGALHVVR